MYAERYYTSHDGLKLYYRDYEGDARKTPVVCLHGLTRNCQDFESLANRISPARRVITPDARGRGKSQYDPAWLNYHPGTYVADTWRLLETLGLSRVIVVGTSLGGIMAMLMVAMRREALAAVVLNDIGPELDPVGAQRIASYAGKLPAVTSWGDAVAQMKLTFGAALPDYTEERWLAFARASFAEDEKGVPRLAADPRIGDALRTIPAPPGAVQGMWLAFCLFAGIPVLAIRGAHSDLLSAATFERMQREVPGLIRITVPNRGHPPQLDEPEAVAGIEKFLAAIP